MPEILALPEHRLSFLASQGVGEAVTEVRQRRWH